MTIDKLCNNLNLLMAEARISADELSRRTRIPASTIKKIRNRQNPNPTLSTLIPLAEYFTISISQLIGHESLPAHRIKGQFKQPPHSLQLLPILSWQEALQWPNIQIQNKKTVATGYQYNKKTFALMVEEEDWENLSKGTLLIVDTSSSPEHRDFVIAHKTGQHIPSLKQLLHDDGQTYLKPVVQGYNIIPLTAEHRLLGVVVEYKKQLKFKENALNDIDEENSS